MFILIFAAVFAYFIVIEQPQCYSKDQKAFGVQYDGTVDVTQLFYWLSTVGIVVLCSQAIMYYVQAREGMYDTMRPCVILVNLLGFIWFVMLQYYRFSSAGAACSGDFLTHNFIARMHGGEAPTSAAQEKLPPYLVKDEGFWILIYIFAQYILYILCRVSTLIIVNKLEAEFDERKALNKF